MSIQRNQPRGLREALVWAGMSAVALLVGLFVSGLFDSAWVALVVGGGAAAAIMLGLALLAREAFGIKVFR